MKGMFKEVKIESMQIGYPLDVTVKAGYAAGIVHDDETKILNWLNKNGVKEEVIQYIMKLPKPIAFLESVEVEEDYRGQGLGTELVYSFMDKVYKAQSIILIADLGQTSYLEKWYQTLDFQTVGHDTAGNPAMVYDG